VTSSREGPSSLADVQDWLGQVVSSPGGLREGLARAAMRYGPALPVRVPPGVHPGERLAIHARGYLDRLLSCLRADFPAVLALLGDSMFDAFAMEYLRAHPPRHHSLFELGAGFASHLLATAPPAEAVPADRRPLLRLPIDLAHAERARLEVLRARGTERDDRPGPPLTGLEVLLGEDVQVVVTPCLRTLDLAHDVRGFLAAVDRAEPPVAPDPRATYLAVSRVAYRILWTELSPFQREVLVACPAPRALPALAVDVAAELGLTSGAALADLALWLPVAEGLGLVSLRRAG
jgi:hypothetical protein